MTLFIITTISFFLSLVITACVRQYSITFNVIDVPNERSSHVLPVPRGGGLSIALVVLLSLIYLYLTHDSISDIALSLIIPIVIVGITGWIDDHKDVAFYWRFISYSVAAFFILFWHGGIFLLEFGRFSVEMPVLIGYLVSFLGLVWMTNLYNFMDGTDAFAAVESIAVSVFAGFFCYINGGYGFSLICFVIATSSLGFLYWNRPPAKIFMGDVGSCVLGFLFGALALLSDKEGFLPITVWCILLSVFICDTTFTLFRRIITGEKWYQAHRSHAYQILVQKGMTHGKLALYLSLLNVLVLWPCAYLALYHPEYSLLISFSVIILLYILWHLIQSTEKSIT